MERNIANEYFLGPFAISLNLGELDFITLSIAIQIETTKEKNNEDVQAR